MNIYIYGNKSFKSDIHKTLDKFNIKLRLSDFGSIIQIDKLSILKQTIEDFPDYIYLIDEKKIIKDNTFNGKIKFLQPKDGIEKSFLIKNGIKDLEVDSFTELGKYIVKKVEDYAHENENLDFSSDTYENDSVDAIKILTSSENESMSDVGQEYLVLDEELSSLLKHVEPEPTKNEIKEIKEVINSIEEDEDTQTIIEDEKVEELEINSFDEELNDSEDLDDLFKELEINTDAKDEVSDDEGNLEEEDLASLFKEFEEENSSDENHNLDEMTFEESIEGENMVNNFSSLDDLNEKDILAALNGKSIELSETEILKSCLDEEETKSIKVDVENSSDIAKLLSQLLANKTLEITVKIKD